MPTRTHTMHAPPRPHRQGRGVNVSGGANTIAAATARTMCGGAGWCVIADTVWLHFNANAVRVVEVEFIVIVFQKPLKMVLYGE